MTRIVVTHALDEELLKRYDGIIVLKAGQVVENGSYEELMMSWNKELYRKGITHVL